MSAVNASVRKRHETGALRVDEDSARCSEVSSATTGGACKN